VYHSYIKVVNFPCFGEIVFLNVDFNFNLELFIKYS